MGSAEGENFCLIFLSSVNDLLVSFPTSFFLKTEYFVYYNVANQIVPLLVIVFVAGYWYRLQLFAEVPIPSACVQLVF